MVAVKRPLVIAHRGASDDIPEHTTAAYERALVDGADGFEADVRLTADAHLVCVHDRRLERTSNGTGVLSTMTLAELEELDFGSWKAGELDELPERMGDRSGGSPSVHRVLTLPRLLELALHADRPVPLLIETKHPTRYAGFVEQRLAEELRRHGLDGSDASRSRQVPVTLMTFSEVALMRMRRLTPQLPLVFLMDRVPIRFRSGELPRGVAVAGPGVHILREHPRYVSRVHAQGHRVFVWTVDDPDDVALATDMEVDAIITNRPGAVVQLLDAASDS
jgi:glycerophosphoryl diester phosphodiesterase